MDLAALSLTLRLAALTTALLLIVATPLAAWLAGLTPFSSNTLARKLVQAAIALPLVLPPTVLGFYLLVGLGPTTALGRAIITLLGHPLAFTFPGLVVGSCIYSLPFAVQPLVTAFASVDPTLVDTARVLGANPFATFYRILLPLSRQGILTAAVLTFAHTVGEFGVVLMIGGDIPGSTRTMSISIFDQVQEGNYTAANHASLALLALSFVALLLVYWRGANTRRSPVA
jgi:molybdate transport system permease protein